MSAHEAIRAQRSAARPDASAWVSANAGSGKTRVLTERVARLLLDGAAPAKILCLTYTKAAAAEMRVRLFDMLGGWTMAEDEKLAKALGELTHGDDGGPTTFGSDALDRARRLFAEALETPGGLKIQTIHAFCDSLLRRFPLEAGAPPGFRVMEDFEQDELIRDTLDALARDETTDGGGAAALRGIVDLLNESGAIERAKEAVGKRDLFTAPPDETAICRAFGVEAPPDRDAARAAAIRSLDLAGLRRMIAAWSQGAKTDQARAASLDEAQAKGGAALADGLVRGLLTKDRAPLKRLASKDAQAAEPDHEALCSKLVEVALAAVEAENAAVAADRAIRLGRFGHAMVRRYEAAKAASGLLDFDDLVGKARDLLTRSEACDWVLYRLDGGVDHILVDEAQDTSRPQWDVIDAIAREFRADAGARGGPRTSFVVGDEKQSIYRFQGAAPEMFDGMRGIFAQGLEPHGGQVEEELAFSFRSAPAILAAVDATFADMRAEGLNAADAPPRHAAFHETRAGRVELWPLVADDPKPDPPEAWAPIDAPSPRSARIKLAEMVADRVKDMVGGERLPGGGRRIRPEDVIILLPARKPMMRALVRGLKSRGVPVGGADRLMLTGELAVKDLLALLAFAATPEDDLALACLLRSPLFGLSEEDLFHLAHGRGGTLWRAMLAAEDRHPEAVARLRGLLDRDGYERPYELLETALVAWDGRRRFMARLGPEADDAIDELLSQAIVFEETGTPTVEAFLSRMAADEVEIKRQQEGRGGEVRVMSAHGAKGLEAPVVILPDTTRRDQGARGWSIARLETAEGAIAAMPAGKRLDPTILAAAREREAAAETAEGRRLLYVAMTRAEDWLIVAGAGEDDDGGKLDGTWYGMIRAGLGTLPTESRPSPAGDAVAYETGEDAKTESEAAPGAPEEATAAPPQEAPLPAPPSPPRRIERRAASALGGEAETVGRLAPALAARRGEAIHAALEAGTTDPTEARRLVAPFDLGPDVAEDAVREALAVRALPEAARFFAEDAVAEAGVAVTIGGVRVIGRIDRLCVTPEAVAFVDFKSDARPPGPGEAPGGYLAQLAAYRAALAGLYPGKRIETHLLWTALPRLDLIGDASLNSAAAALLRGGSGSGSS